MPTKKKPVRRAKVRQPRLVQAESATINKWLRQTARSNYPVKDRLEMLLWSWPIYRAIGVRSSTPLWRSGTGGDNEILTRLTSLAETLYPNTWYPDPLYSMEWHPYDSPLQMHDGDFKEMCHDICNQLRALPGITVPDPHDDLLWLCKILEHGWGDKDRDGRRELQEQIVVRLDEQTRRRVCEIGERARDDAYRQVRTDRCLDAQRRDKERAKQLKDWLREVPSHAPFIEEHLARPVDPTATALTQDLSAFAAAFQTVKAQRTRVTEYVNAYMKNVFEDTGRDRRATAGRPGRGAWVEPADRALKRLQLSQQERRTLLIAWSLVPLERDAPPGSQ